MGALGSETEKGKKDRLNIIASSLGWLSDGQGLSFFVPFMLAPFLCFSVRSVRTEAARDPLLPFIKGCVSLFFNGGGDGGKEPDPPWVVAFGELLTDLRDDKLSVKVDYENATGK